MDDDHDRGIHTERIREGARGDGLLTARPVPEFEGTPE